MSVDWAPTAKIQHNGVILCGYLPLVIASNIAQYRLPSVSALHLNFVHHQNQITAQQAPREPQLDFKKCGSPGDKNVGVIIKCSCNPKLRRNDNQAKRWIGYGTFTQLNGGQSSASMQAIFYFWGFETTQKLFRTTNCWSRKCPQTFAPNVWMVFSFFTKHKTYPAERESLDVDKSSSTTSARIKSEVGSLHQWHMYFFPSLCGIGRGRRIHLIYHWLIHLSEPGHVISLSIHPTCSNHKFPFSSRSQLARLESQRRLSASFQFWWGLLEPRSDSAVFIQGLTLSARLQFLLAFVLMHPQPSVSNMQLPLKFVTLSPGAAAKDF